MFRAVLDIPAEILRWSESRPAWQRDALRRVMVQPTIEPADIAELAAMAKVASGIAVAGAREPSPLLAEHLSRSHAEEAVVTLAAVKGARNVNALVPGQMVRFAETGLTIVYGENGAGKSGYARLLSKACRARRAEPIIQNINGPPSSDPPSATFTVKTAEGIRDVQWEQDKESPAELARVAVFDRSCERSFIDEEDAPTFLPAGLDVFNELVGVVERVKKEIEVEVQRERPQDNLADLAPLVAGSVEVAALVSRITGMGPEDFPRLTTEVEALAASDSDRAALVEGEKRLADLRVNDPSVKAASMRSLAASVARTRAAAETAILLMDEQAVTQLRKAVDNKVSAAGAVNEAAKIGLADEAGLVSDLGMAFLRATEVYAVTHVHPGHSFPDSRPDALCPLCRQDLDDDTRVRFGRLHQLLTRATTEQVAKASRDLDELIARVMRAEVPAVDVHVVEEVAKVDAEAAEALKLVAAAVSTTKAAVLKAATDGAWGDVPLLCGSDLDPLRRLEAQVTKSAAETAKLADPKEQEELKRRIARLKAKVALADQKARVIAFVSMARKSSELARCSVGINTKAITTEGSAIATKAMTGGLEAAFKEEMDVLGASGRIQVSINQRGEKGRTLYGIRMPGSAPTRWSRSQVLSEGEQRVVALAYFLAEMRLAPHKVTLVIDDPVNSLGYAWSRRIGERLLHLAKERQVVVFTHCIAFFTQLSVDAIQFETPLHRQCLTRGAKGPGYCDDENMPWEKLEIGTRVQKLNARLKDLRAIHATNPAALEYREGAASICSYLRAAWERAVEEVVLNGVVERFGYAVKTQSMAGLVCDEETFKTVYDAMTRLSATTPAHDHAAGGADSLPSPDQLVGEIKALDDFVRAHKKKVKDAQDLRKERVAKASAAPKSSAGPATGAG